MFEIIDYNCKSIISVDGDDIVVKYKDFSCCVNTSDNVATIKVGQLHVLCDPQDLIDIGIMLDDWFDFCKEKGLIDV